MAVSFDGKRVSRRWGRVLNAARAAGVRFTLTSGRRTMREQTALFRQNMVWTGLRFVQRPGRPLTAFPSPLAPHIRVGRQAHAVDVNSLDGGETRLEAWIEGQGADWQNTVAGEAWHGELSEADLKRLAKRIAAREQRAVRLKAKGRRLNPQVRTVSSVGLAFIARWEGFVPYVYNDAANHATVLFGHLLHHGPATAADRARWGTKENPKGTRREGLRLLRADSRAARNAVRELVKVPLDRGEFDALVSFVFNVGIGAFASSTLLRKLNAGQRNAAARQFLRWNKAGGRTLLGLSRRRRAERALFLKGHR